MRQYPPPPAIATIEAVPEFVGTLLDLYLVQGTLPCTFPKKLGLDDLVRLINHFLSNLTGLFLEVLLYADYNLLG